MPIVHVEMLEGRSKDQKENLIKDMVKAVETHTGAPKEAVTVIIDEIKKENIATKGNYHG
ncbi:MAG: 2-hydroxymuconate tautomerase family protein [Alkalibacterium sp.]|nr:2-hydroxymuconate tautomerase family protein [Alkalibacterium sp.]TVP90406.1 MAG: 4-oxalocrotonate tautomerase [Alkalibacterium sp.]